MIELLKKLISINSISGNEEEIISFISDFLNQNSVEHKKIGNNIIVELGKGQKTLCIVAHIDTVPATDGWSSGPFKVSINDDKIFGLGAVDNKSSVSTLLELILEFQEIELNGKIIFVFTSEEESNMNGIETVLSHIKPDSAIICEPTNLIPCTAQKGFVNLNLKTKGKNSHAAFPGKGDNAIYKMIKELEKIKNITFEKEYPLLGYPTISPTIISGGIEHNIIPDKCEVILDIRTTPIYDNNTVIEEIKNIVDCKIEVLSNRLKPIETKNNEFVKIAEEVCDSKSTGFLALSEMCFFDCPAIVLGPGFLEQAHKPDEYIEISQLEKAKNIYKKIIKGFLS